MSDSRLNAAWKPLPVNRSHPYRGGVRRFGALMVGAALVATMTASWTSTAAAAASGVDPSVPVVWAPPATVNTTPVGGVPEGAWVTDGPADRG